MTTNGNAIRKGFILKARKIEDSAIAHAAPCTREVWDLILRKANFRDQKCGHTVIRRGQWLTTYEEIQELLHWRVGFRKIIYTRHQIEAAMKFLRSGSMVTTAKATRGLFITALNYDLYQHLENYEHHNENPNEDHSNATLQRRMKECKIFSPNSDEFRLARLLFDLIREHNQNFREPNLQKWALHISRMIRLDNRSPERIERVIRWCQADRIPRGPNGFCWAVNILSTEKLRPQFDQLETKMQAAEHQKGAPAEVVAPVVRGTDGLTPRERALAQMEAAK